MSREQARWIWYPGDLELYHAMKQNFSRVERGITWPAFWKSEGCRQRVAYRRSYDAVPAGTVFRVLPAPGTIGFVRVNGRKCPLNAEIACEGKVAVTVHAACIASVPAVYIEGDVICSVYTCNLGIDVGGYYAVGE